MKNFSNLSKLALAVATATMLAGTAGFAMDNQFTELDKIIKLDLEQLGIPVPDFSKLTYTQVGDISDVLSTKDKGADQQKAEIEQILNAKHDEAVAVTSVKDFPASQELQKIVVQDLSAIGVEVKNPEKLTLDQLGKLTDILNSDKDNEGMKQDAEMVLNS